MYAENICGTTHTLRYMRDFFHLGEHKNEYTCIRCAYVQWSYFQLGFVGVQSPEARCFQQDSHRSTETRRWCRAPSPSRYPVMYFPHCCPLSYWCLESCIWLCSWCHRHCLELGSPTQVEVPWRGHWNILD